LTVEVQPLDAMLTALKVGGIDLKIWQIETVGHLKTVNTIADFEGEWASELPSLIVVDYRFVGRFVIGV
jgi:hypothetical protein